MRAARGGSATTPQTWQDLGLNGKRFGEYYASVRRAGFEVVRFKAIPVKQLEVLTRLPLVKDLFIFGIDCHVRRPIRHS
jgi:hypothetical protein